MKPKNYGGSNEQILTTAHRASQSLYTAALSHDFCGAALLGLFGNDLRRCPLAMVDADLCLRHDTGNVIMNQATMFEALEAPRNIHEAKFMEFHQANPIVYKLWDQFTREALARGVNRVGSGLILERIRWETSVNLKDETADGKKVKICNHHKVFYARLWMKNNPHHQVFETRKIKGDYE